MKRFWDKVNKTKTCWLWGGAVRPSGYGAIKYNTKTVSSHRMSWFLVHGEFPLLFVCHKCDNPLCVKPSHLFLGTQSDNMKDCASKGRINNWNKGKKYCKHGTGRMYQAYKCRCEKCKEYKSLENKKRIR